MKPKGLYCFTEPKRETLVAGTYPGGDTPHIHGALQGLNGVESMRGRVGVGNLKQSHPPTPYQPNHCSFLYCSTSLPSCP